MEMTKEQFTVLFPEVVFGDKDMVPGDVSSLAPALAIHKHTTHGNIHSLLIWYHENYQLAFKRIGESGKMFKKIEGAWKEIPTRPTHEVLLMLSMGKTISIAADQFILLAIKESYDFYTHKFFAP